MTLVRRVAFAVAALAFAGVGARAQHIATADLQIQGVGLRVITVSTTTGLDIPAAIQTEFGGKQNDEAANVEGLTAVGELDGPGIEIPIRLETAPGHKFAIPALSREGVYFLRNIRLMKGTEFLQPATPSVATITVSNLLQTAVTVRQLTPDELRARGITLDARNYDVFEYTFSFFIEGKLVEIPFPVVIDKRTREVTELPRETPYVLPPTHTITPPRWSPPEVVSFGLGGGGGEEGDGEEEPPPPAAGAGGGRPSIPAALVIPNNLGVLHQFFAVTLMVTNGAPAGSNVVLDGVTAKIRTPTELRTVKSIPAAAFNQPVPVVDAATGVTFLIAQAKGDVEWTVEGLKPGTHTLEVEVRATYKSPGQADFPLKGTARASIVVHDPRFNISFSHPDTVRKGIDYTTYSFITNMSPVTQTIRVGSTSPACAQSPAANVCRLDDTPEVHELTIPPGEMRMIEYKLRPSVTGSVFANAGSVSDDNLTASVQLFMGVSESGIPLSPATLVMPHYARYVNPDLVEANLQLLGLGYSLATAPLTQTLATQPRVIKTDVFQRALDISRAGQRLFIGEPSQDAINRMALDLLGNGLELREWDQLRRREKSGRSAGAAVIREMEKGTANGTSINAFVDRFAAKTAHGAGYALALLHGAAIAGNERPYALSMRGTVTGRRTEIPNEAASGWIRDLPFADLSRFTSADSSRTGEIAIAGRWTEKLELTIEPTTTGPMSLELIYPAAADGSLLRAHADFNGTAGTPLKVTIDRGDTSVNVRDGLGAIIAVASVVPVAPEPLTIIAARQDLHLDSAAHKVSVLFSRPVSIAEADDWLAKFHGQVILNKDGVNYTGPRPIASAALQGDSRIVNLTFDHALSQNASYSIAVDPVLDPLTGTAVSFAQPVTPVIDNDRPGGIIFGHVLKADNTPIANAEVVLTDETAPQYDTSNATNGSFLFEFVPRDVDNDISGNYLLTANTTEGKSTSVNGAVRLPGRVHFVNLVFLGRGSAEGYVRYDNGQVVAGARVVAGSTMFNQFRQTTTDASGFYQIGDLPVGPLTFSATDADGNVTFGASEIKTPGQVLVKDLSIFRRPFPGTGTIRGLVKRSDTNAAVAGAHVGVYSQGYGLIDGYTDSAGRFEFTKVPSGFVTVLAAEWTVSRESVALDFDLANDETRDVTMTLDVAPAVPLVTIAGDVIRENPLFPNDPSKYEKVAGAVVKIELGQAVTADALGHYVIENVPQTADGRRISAYDPLTTRSATKLVPSLDPGQINNVPFFIAASTANSQGEGTVRVRVLNAAGFPATGLRVIWPGFPPTPFTELTNGVYQLTNVPVGQIVVAYAISAGGTYGDQFATGSAKVEFNGHVAAMTLRLGGQGIVRVKLRADIDIIGDVALTYPAWDELEQGIGSKTVTANTAKNGVADYAVFEKVPANRDFEVASQHPIYGYAGQDGKLGFDGDLQSITLQLNKLSTVRGVVYAIDGRTPISGAAVRIEDGRQNQGIFTTLPDGSFVFHNEPAATPFRIVAEVTQDGVYRTGYARGATPALGGPVDDVAVILRTQGSVEGRIVYSAFKKYDPQNPANNIADDTPNDLSDNAPVPLARFSMRELDFPSRSFGTTTAPLSADVLGRFSFNNVFTGPLRVSASDPGNQEFRGAWKGTLTQEGETLTAFVGIGGAGFGPVTVTVVDPNNQNAPVFNAEVSLISGGLFDFGTTDAAGRIEFDEVPVGTYTIAAYSKALGRSGASSAFNVVASTGATVQVVLEFSGKVTGKLSDPEDGGRGIPGAHVTLNAFNFDTRATTDTAGAFLFEGVREGLLRFSAKDTLSNRRASATRTLSQADPEPFVSLELEPTETLHLSVYHPDDAGGNSNVLVPVVDLDVTQRCAYLGPCEFQRSLQGNSFQMAELLKLSPYTVVVQEVGGLGRQIKTSASFPKGSAADPLKLVFAAYGNVEVRVTQGSGPAANAKVTVSGGGRSATVYTDAAGIALATGIGLGTISVQAVTVDGLSSGSASGTLSSQSIPAVVNIALGTAGFAGISGYVEAETGGPSSGTRVVATFSGVLETLTDSNGRYTFNGIPTSSNVSLVYVGPDDITVGARQSIFLRPEDASKTVPLPNVKLDASLPQLLSFFPADGAQNVSPDTTLRFVFSEAIRADQINKNFIQLIPADSSTPVNGIYTSSSEADGTFVVRLTPPPPPAGRPFPLESNTLYRIIVSGEIRDLTGNKMPGTRGAVFITSDYTEPRVVGVTPATTTPLQPATTFRFTFNEPIDPAPWQPNGGAQFHLYKLTAAGPGGAIAGELAGNAFVDPATSLTLIFSPNEPIQSQSFYRAVFSGVRDMQGNPAPEQTFHFFSFDEIRPFVILVSPVPATFPLISGVEYTLTVDLRNGDANGAPATDVARVDYLRMDGATPTFIFGTTKAPFSYRFVAPDVPPEGATLVLRAEATDLSGNLSEPATMSWTVQPNKPPQNVAIALTPPTSSYANNKVNAAVTFEDEGILATVQVELTATQSDGTPYLKSLVKQAARATVDLPWPSTSFDFDLPATLKETSTATFSAAVTDARGQRTTATASLNILEDATKPVILGFSPAAETRYQIGNTYQIEAVVQDLESGVAKTTFQFDGQTITVLAANATPGPQPRSWRFVSGQITVPAKNIDTRIPITVTAYDYHGNTVAQTVEVVYVGVNDPTVPKAAWLCPVDRSALPASQTALALTLQVRATDDIAITAVKFQIPGVADPVAATRVGATDVYQAAVSIPTPAAGTPFAITAIVSDANPEHDVLLPIAIPLVAVDIFVDDRIQAIIPSEAASYEGKSIAVRGATARLVPHVAVTLKNLIVLNGGRVETLSTTTTTEQRLQLTITEHLFIDCASSIDVSGRGYLGGWGLNPDGSNTRNDDMRGRTVGNTAVGGPTTFAGASHGGIGGEQQTGVTNAVYGSITNPTDLGTGGGGGTSCCSAGASGGGAAKLQGGVFAIGGAIRANGDDRDGNGNPGSGGSINISGTHVITGPAARITANGGDDDPVNNASRGAGGGRIAIVASERFEIETLGLQVAARGGRNDTGNEAASHVDAGAGTIFLRRPGQTHGELFVSAFDERFPASTHLTRATPIAATNAPLHFDRVELGPRALVRADDSITVGELIDDRSAIVLHPTAVILFPADQPAVTATTVPPADSSLVQGGTLSTTYSANSLAGIGAVTLAWTPVTPNRVDSYSVYPPTASATGVALSVPATAATGPATLTVSATDRSGRSAQTAAIPFTIVANAPPAITKFEVVPPSLYPGKSVVATVSAIDDLKVTKLTLTSRINNGTPATQTRTPNVPVVTDQTFTVAVPIDTPGGAPMTLDAAVEDAFPGRAATTQTFSVTILTDTIAPSLSVTSPANNAQYQEGTGAVIQVRATATDAEVAVKQVFIQLDGGTPFPLTPGANNTYAADVPVPPVDGADIVTKQLVVTAKDYQGNAATSAPIAIRIQPLFDPNAPVINWTCSTSGAMYPAGYNAKLRVFAIGNDVGNAANGVQKVEFFVDGSTTPIAAAAVTGLANHYEATFAIPTAADGTVVSIRAIATNTAGLSSDIGTQLIVVAGTTITANTTISATDTSFDNKTVIVQSGTTIITGPHAFTRLIVLGGAKVTHAATDASTIHRLTFTAQSVYVACDASIDTSGLGFAGATAGTGRTWPNATAGGSHNGAGGSHGGRGGAHDANGESAQAFGSVLDPNEPGGAGGLFNNGTCTACNPGGGIVRVQAPSIVVDGKVLANGVNTNSGGGAGGSIRLDVTSLSGAGEIRADGASGTHAAGGGGRIAVYYSSLTLDRAKITASGALHTNNQTRTASAGTVYFQQVLSGSKLADELVLDNTDRVSLKDTPLAALGSGTVTAVNGATLTLSTAVPEFVEGSWIEFAGSSNAIVSRTATTVTVDGVVSAAPGAAYRGTWRFDQVTARRQATLSADALRVPLINTTSTGLVRVNELRGDELFVRGRVEANSAVTATSLALQNGATLMHSPTTSTAIQRLNVNVSQILTIDATSAIDVSGRGFTGATTGTGRTWPNATTGGSHNGAGGSHGGRGGAHDANGDSGAAFGSVFDPSTPGGAGGFFSNGTCNPCNAGGGVARINARTIALDGKILANGVNTNSGGGAGGSIRIDAESLAGAGEIRADGATGTHASGGGGRIAIYSQTLGVDLSKITAAGGTHATNATRVGGAGTIYFRDVDPSGVKLADELLLDNRDRIGTHTTPLATAGSGTVTAVSGATITLSNAVPEWIEGSWIDFFDATGARVSRYAIAARTATTVTVTLASGESAANVSIGNTYRGLLRVDLVTVRGAAMVSADTFDIPALASTTNAFLQLADLRSDALTLRGWLKVTGNVDVTVLALDAGARLEADGLVKSTDLTIRNGGILTHSPTTSTSVAKLTVQATNLTIDAASAIDVSGRGYTGAASGRGRTWPNTTTGGSHNGAGGSHGGRGGAHDGNGDSGLTYGSLFDPTLPGAAGGFFSNGTCNPCNAGGGIARITASNFTLDGKVIANGTNTNSGGGAGGSIRVDAGTLSGSGEIRADGATGTHASGGGGRVAVYYQALTLDRAKIGAAGGIFGTNTTRTGAAGTVYLKQTSQTYGDLVVDNTGRSTTKNTALTSVGFSTVSEVGATFVRDTNAQFPAPDFLAGIRLILNNDKSASWAITGNDAKTVTVDVTQTPLTAQTGHSFRGLYRFDNLKLRNARLKVLDLIESLNAIDKDAPSVLLGSNLPPVLTPSLITLQSTATGSVVLGAAGAVSDPDTPVTLTAVNTASTNVYTATANADGSFAVPVQGNTGDSITLKARDANFFPLESPVLSVGTLTSGTPTPTQLDRTTWTADASFRARELATDGRTLLVSGVTDKLVVLNTNDPARPEFVRTVAVANGAINDVAITKGWAVIASNDLVLLDLSSTTSTPIILPDPDWFEHAVVVDGGFAFTSTNNGNDGRIRIYDVSDPATSRYVREQGFGLGNVTWDALATYGHYLIAMTNAKPGGVGHDVVVFDKTNVFAMVKIADLDIPNFDATSGYVSGSRLYVTGLGGRELVVVELANPGNPTVTGRITLPAPNNVGGVQVIKNSAFVADGTTGLVEVDVTSAPSIIGAISVGGTAFDVALDSPYAYVANDNGLAVVPISTPPQIFPERITLGAQGTTATITGSERAIRGSGPFTIEAKNVTRNMSATAPVAADGSFSVSVAALSNDAISVEATDAAGRKSGAIPLGVVPFGSGVLSEPFTPSMSESAYRARTIATDGTHLIVGGWADGGTTRLVIYDVSANPAVPQYQRTVSLGNGAINNVAIRNGWAIVAANDLVVLDLSNPASTPVILPDPDWFEHEVLVQDGYAFTSTNNGNDGRIRIYNVSNPGNAHYLREQGMGIGNMTFVGLAALGSRYLLAFSDDRPGGVGHDVVVIDRSNVYGLVKIADLDIPDFNGFRGKVVGSTLYLAGTGGGVAVVDLSAPHTPVVRAILPTGDARGIDVAGATVAVGAGSAGVKFLDVSNPHAPVVTGTQPVGGTAWAVAFNRGNLYVANEQGLAVIQNIATAPMVHPSRVTITPSSGTLATVAGGPFSVTGIAPLTIEVKNAVTGTSISGQTVGANGTFSVLIPAKVTETIVVEATDVAGRKSGPVSVGQVPFGSAVTQHILSAALTGQHYHARTIATEGNHIVVGGWADGNTTKLVVYDATDPAAPQYVRSVTLNNGAINNVAIHNGWAVVAANDLIVLDLSSTTSTPIILPDPDWFEHELVISGGYAFTSTNNGNDGRIRIYDVSTPSGARYVREQGMGIGNMTFVGLAALGTSHILAFSDDRPSGVGHDLVVIDRANIHGLVKVADIDIPNFNAFRGKVVGTTLYLAGRSGGLAVIDMSNPSVPVVRQVTGTGGSPHGVDGSGSMLAVADGGSGVTFLNIADPLNPQLIGTQPVGGNAWSLAFNRGNLYVANDQGLAVISNVGAAPLVAASLITVTSNGIGTATITGVAGAVTGAGALTVEGRNMESGVTTAGNVLPNGSFSISLAGVPGDRITIEATDEVGRKSGRVFVGIVPFGTISTHLIGPSISQAGYRSRTLAADGDRLIVGGYNDANTTRLIIFDISDPALPPQYQRSVSLNNGPINNVAIRNGWAIVAANDLVVLDLTNPASSPIILPDPDWFEYELLVSGGFAFTGTNNGNDGRIRIYDVSNPGAARYLREQGFGLPGILFTGITEVGSDYIVASTREKTTGGIGHDVVVIDRTNVHALVKVADLDIPNFDAFRGKAIGSTLYLGGIGGGLAIVDLSDPKAPVLKMVLETAGDAFSADATGSTLAVADGAAGVTLFDVTNPFVPQLIGTQPAGGGTVWSTVFSRGALYAVNEQALLAVRNVATPVVDRTRIDIRTDSAAAITVTGTARAVTGVAPHVATLRNATTNAISAAVPVAADGSFTAPLAASPMDRLVLTVTDGGGRVSTMSLGRSPFGTTVTQLAGSAQAGDAAFRARRVASNGTATIVGSGSTFGLSSATQSGRVVVFRPDLVKSYNAGGAVNEIIIHNGYALIAANDFASLNLADPNATPFIAPDPAWFEYSVTIAGNHAYTSTNNGNDGRIRLYNITNPAHPTFFREQGTGLPGITYQKLLTLGGNYIVAMTAEKTTGGVGHDVVVFDATNPSSLVKLVDFDVPDFNALDGVIDGTTLYLVGGDAGVAVIDLASPSSPQVKAIVNTPGNARGIALSGVNEIAVADGSSGITLIDTTNRSAPVILGTQPLLNTNTAGVHVVGKNIYAASENHFHVISRP